MSASRRPDLLATLFLLGVATLLYGDVLFAGNNLWFRDLFLYHFPMKQLVREVIARGEFPWWNPLFSGGQPMAANPAYEIFYPPQWLIFIGPYRFGFALHIVAHVWLALAGMYALLRAMSLRLEAALFGALSFGAGGLLTGSITNLPTFFVWSWAPLVACCALRYVQAPTRGRFAAAAIVMAMPLLVSEPMALAQLWLLLLIGALIVEDRRGRLSSIKALFMMTGVAVAVAAVQLLPMLDHFRDSARARGFAFSVVSDFSMPPMRPLELLVPHLFGYLDEHGTSFWGGHAFAPRNGPYLLSIYCGLAVVILVITGMAARLRGARVVAALLASSYLLALGSYTPLLGWLYAAGLRSIRYPEKFVAMGLVAAIVFAAWTAHQLLEGDERVRRTILTCATVVGGASAITAAGLWLIVPSEWRALTSTATMTAIGLAIGWLAVAWLLCGGGRLRPPQNGARDARRHTLWAALLLLLAELGSLAAGFEPRMPRPFFEAPPVAAALRNGTYFNRGEWLLADVNRAKFIGTYGPWTARNGLAPLTGAAWGIATTFDRDIDETFLLPTHDLLGAMQTLGNSGFPRWSEPFMILSDVRYVSDYRDFDTANRESGGDSLKLQPLQIRGARTQGRFFFPTQLVTIGSQEQLLESLRANPFPFRTAFVPFPAFTPAPARVLGARETSSTAAIDVESSGPSFLVATVTRHKYWRATIDGHEAQLLPANIAYMGLAVPPGRHHIELRYRNPLVVAGGVVTLVALLALALIRVTPLHSAR